MTIKNERENAVRKMIAEIKEMFTDGYSDEALELAKVRLIELASKRHLFSRDDFPLPLGDAVDRTYLVYAEDDESYALYVDTGVPGQTTKPHDHGGSWAIVAGVEGHQKHKLYKAAKGETQPGIGTVDFVGEFEVTPENGVSIRPDGIHSIYIDNDQPITHLHLYGFSFNKQKMRKEYDLENGTYEEFTVGDYGEIEDAR